MERIMKYKVGDRVRVKSGLNIGQEYGDYTFKCGMDVFRGLDVIISSVSRVFRHYTIQDDQGAWDWTDEMFEPLESENPADESNVSEDWVLCKDGSESPMEAVEAPENVDCLLEAKFREAVNKITAEELKEIILKKIEESVDNMSGDMFQDILADVLS